MKKILGLLAFFTPAVAFADVMPGMGNGGLDSAISFGYFLSMIGFLVATFVTLVAVRKFGQSALGSIFSYLLIGTGIFFLITVFQTLGGAFFGISDQSMDVWWHIMFYMAFIFYFFGLKQLVGLGSAEQGSGVKIGMEKTWGLFAVFALGVIFVIPKWAEPLISQYDVSVLYSMGVHHFIAFALAAIVGYYLLMAKKNLGQIGRSIADPMIVSIFALALQHFWELLNESWKVVVVTDNVGEGVEKIFLIIAAGGLTYAAYRLNSFAKGQH
jgi:hypothetical protein